MSKVNLGKRVKPEELFCYLFQQASSLYQITRMSMICWKRHFYLLLLKEIKKRPQGIKVLRFIISCLQEDLLQNLSIKRFPRTRKWRPVDISYSSIFFSLHNFLSGVLWNTAWINACLFFLHAKNLARRRENSAACLVHGFFMHICFCAGIWCFLMSRRASSWQTVVNWDCFNLGKRKSIDLKYFIKQRS